MDQNHAAWKLAEAAHSGSIEQVEDAFKDNNVSIDTIALAFALCLREQPFTSLEAPRLVLREYLQLKLVQAHVAAQERMGGKINRLTWALIVLTLFILILTGALAWLAFEEHRQHASGDTRAAEPVLAEPSHQPAGPISILLTTTTTIEGKDDHPGVASGPKPSTQSEIKALQGFDPSNAARRGGCFEDKVTPLYNGENMRVLKCAQDQTDVPFFGHGLPSRDAVIWLLYWLNPGASVAEQYLAYAAYASYGSWQLLGAARFDNYEACWTT